jgi:hypothetical protein
MPQFRKGQSGNPAGRPPGSRYRATSMVQNLLEGAAENIAKRAAQLAEDGNVAAIRICMNRLSPLGQHNPVAFELPPIHFDAGLSARHVRHPDRHRQWRYCTLRGDADRQADRRAPAGDFGE